MQLILTPDSEFVDADADHSYSDTVTIRCKSGQLLIGGETMRTCLMNSSWSGKQIQCKGQRF